MITVKQIYALLLALAMLLSACAAAPNSTTPSASTEPTKAVQETQDGTNENIEGTTATEGSTAPEPSDPTLGTDSTQPSTEVTVPTTEPPVTDPTKTPTIPTEPDETFPPVTTVPAPTEPPTIEPEPTVPPTTAPTIPPTTDPPETEPTQPSTAPTEPTVPTEPKAELEFAVSKPEVEVGKTYKAEYTYTGSKSLTWSSYDTSVATVNSKGVITGVAVGTTVISVTDGTVTARCTVKVISNVELKFSVSKPEVEVGKTYTAEYTYTGNKSLTWTSDNTSVATVNSNGVITGVKAGSAMIKVTDGTVTARCTVYVRYYEVYVSEIIFRTQDGPLSDGITKYAGDFLWFVGYTLPYEASKDIRVTSSDSSVVSVSYSGSQAGVTNGVPITLNFKSAGTATITLTSGDGAVTQSYTIHVKADYDFNPGSGLLSPEKFADYATRVMCTNGFTEYPCTSWRLMTLSADELTFARAVNIGQGYVHDWWPVGDRYCQIVYVGQDEYGDYQFHTCWG